MQLSYKIASTVLIATLFGCGNTATITRSNGPSFEARIVGSDRDRIYVEGARAGIPREEIIDIDHPGNGAAVAGGILSAYGVLNIAVGASDCGIEGLGLLHGCVPSARHRSPVADLRHRRLLRDRPPAAAKMAPRSTAMLKLVPAPLVGPSGSVGFGLGGTF